MPLTVVLPDDSEPTSPRRCLYCQSTNVYFDDELGCYECLNPRCNEQWYYSSDTPFSALVDEGDGREAFDLLDEIELPPESDRDFDKPLYIGPWVYEEPPVLEDDLD